MAVFNSENNDGKLDVDKWEMSTEQNCLYSRSLDSPVSEKELVESVRKLMQGKQVLDEMLKSAGALATRFLTEYFNEIFQSYSYPDTWTRAVIVPINKKGDTGAAYNYRGISLQSFIWKSYTTILSKIYECMEDNKIAET